MRIKLLPILLLCLLGLSQCTTSGKSLTVTSKTTSPKIDSSTIPQFINLSSDGNNTSVDSSLIKRYGFTKPINKQVLSKSTDSVISAPANSKSNKDKLFSPVPKK